MAMFWKEHWTGSQDYVFSPGFTTTTTTTITASTTLAVTHSTKSYHLLSICCVLGRFGVN